MVSHYELVAAGLSRAAWTSQEAVGMLATVIALLGTAVLILLFERKRARQIERDLRDQARSQRAGRRTDRQGDGQGHP